MTDHLLVSQEDGVAYLTLNRPEVRNALSIEMRSAMIDEVMRIEQDPSVRCVVLQGAGGHFMAGGDVKSFKEFAEMPPAARRTYFEKRIHTIHPMIIALQRMPKPVIASVRGGAAGAGLSFMLACDMAIAADDAFFKLSYSAIGASPDGSGSYYLPRLVGVRKAMEIAMLGDRFEAAEAKELGLVNWVVPAADLEEETSKLANRLANSATVALGNIKELIHASHGNSLEAQLAMEAAKFGECAASDDWAEGVFAFNEKRKPVFTGK